MFKDPAELQEVAQVNQQGYSTGQHIATAYKLMHQVSEGSENTSTCSTPGPEMMYACLNFATRSHDERLYASRGMRQKLLQSRAMATSDPGLHRNNATITKTWIQQRVIVKRNAASDDMSLNFHRSSRILRLPGDSWRGARNGDQRKLHEGTPGLREGPLYVV